MVGFFYWPLAAAPLLFATAGALLFATAGALLFATAGALLFASPVWANFPLVTGGQAAPIVIDPVESTEPELAEALDDLRKLIVEAAECGVPRVLPAREGLRGPVVVVGRAASLDLSEKDLGYDGYVIRVEENRLVLAGPSLAGTANAIYDLLETDLGVRFVAPGTDGTIVPRRPEISIPIGERRQRPAFALRRAWYNENVLARASDSERESLRRFARRNRAGGIPSVMRHYFSELVSPAAYFSEHPEFFAEVNGQRVADGQLCTTHPYVSSLAVQHWIDRFNREPELRVGSLSPNDGLRFCTCANCRNFGADLTARVLHFMNDVTRRVNAVHPDRYLSFYAYGGIANPPYQKAMRLQTNLIPVVARYGVCQVHPITSAACPSSVRFRAQLEGWAEIAHEIMARDYAYWWPVPDLTIGVMAENLRTYRRLGAIGMSREYLHRGFLSDIQMRVDLQLQWNPAASADSLLAAALRARFADAGPGFRAAIAELLAASAAVPKAAVIAGNPNSAIELYKPATLRSAVKRLEKLAKSSPQPVAERVVSEADLLRASLFHLEAMAATDRYKLTGRGEDRDAARERAAEALELVRHLEEKGKTGSNSIDELVQLDTQLAAPGLRAPLAGTFDYEDDMGRGGFSRRDASRIDGFHPGAYGLSLLPGKIGLVSYRFSARSGGRFERAELHDLVMLGSDTRIELRMNGKVHPIAEGLAHDERELVHDLTPMVRGTKAFTITFWARNTSQKPMLVLDHWGLRGEVR